MESHSPRVSPRTLPVKQPSEMVLCTLKFEKLYLLNSVCVPVVSQDLAALSTAPWEVVLQGKEVPSQVGGM